MKAIALRHASVGTRSTYSRPAPRPSRRTVCVKAWTGDNAPWAALLRFFTPRKQLGVKDDVWPESNWSGDVSRGRKPFKDGFMGQKLPIQPAADAKAEQAPGEGGAMEYLNQAAERVVNHNFKGDDSEPQWGDLGAGKRGWSGDIHGSRGHEDKGGFHSKIK